MNYYFYISLELLKIILFIKLVQFYKIAERPWENYFLSLGLSVIFKIKR